MLEEICQFIRCRNLLEPGDRVAVAVSGGADSVALLEALARLRERLGVELAVAHFNHRLRAAESEADAAFVERLAARHGLPFQCGATEVAAEARRSRTNLESAARRLRYAFLRGLVEQGAVRKVATGHTADDQAETVLARFLRGSGTRGLAGIYPAVNGWLVRPLLEQRRAALRSWLESQGVGWREDASNRDLRFTRNRLRAEVLPLLEKFNPRLVEHLAGIAEIARGEDEYWTRVTERLLEQGTEPAAPGSGPVLKLSLRFFVQLLRAEQRRFLRAALQRAGHRGQLDSPQVEALCRLAVSGQSGQRVLLHEWEAVREFDSLAFRPSGQPGSCPYELTVPVPGSCLIPGTGTRLSFDLVGPERGDSGYNSEEERVCDLGLVQVPLTVRNWRPGDRFDSPTGRGIRKVKELLRERRIPVEERGKWPVVVSGSKVVWLRGFPVARAFRMRPSSRAGILIQEEEDKTDGRSRSSPE